MQQQEPISLQLAPCELEALEHIRAQQGLPTVDQAAEWLLKTGLRRSVVHATGSARKLRLVASSEGGQ